MRALGLAVAVLALGACAPPARPTLTDEERQLVAQITRDPYLVVVRMTRDEAGVLDVVTDQGGREVRYRLAPAVEGGRELRLRPVDEALTIPTARSERPGTGPAPRGVTR